MNKISLLSVLVVISLTVQCQTKGEATDWQSPDMYSAKVITVSTEDAEFTCANCTYIEIASESGVSGIFITGKGDYKVTQKKITDEFSACMLRFNPADFNKFVKIEGPEKYSDENKLHAMTTELRAVFRHCYHAGWNVLIPQQGALALNFTGEVYKDLLVSTDGKKKVVYDFDKRKEL